jgi:hypothetical protein
MKIPGVCAFEDCLLDAVRDGLCHAHKDNTCLNCGQDPWEHLEVKVGESVFICKDSLYRGE